MDKLRNRAQTTAISTNRAVIYGVISLAIVVLALLAIRNCDDSGYPERSAEREAIAACRDAQNDELQDLATRRQIRATCDKMERDFYGKWYDREP